MRCLIRNSLFHGADSEKLAEFYHTCGADRYKIYYAREADRHRMWRGRTSPYQRGVSEAPWSDPRGQAVELPRGSTTARQRAYGPAPAVPAGMAVCQSWRLYLLLLDLFTGQRSIKQNFIVNSSVHLCINSSLDGVISFEILKVEFKNSGFRVRLVCTVIHRDRFDDFRHAAKESHFQGFEGFGGGTYGYATSYQTAVLVVSSQVIADVVLMYAGDIVAETEGCQSQKDRAEQARCKFKRILSLLVFSTAAIGLMPV